VQFTGIHINFFDRVKIDIGTFSGHKGYQTVSETPSGIREQTRMLDITVPAACTGELSMQGVCQTFTEKQVMPMPLAFFTYDASGCPKICDISKGMCVDCYV
jgi:hypothetical protein